MPGSRGHETIQRVTRPVSEVHPANEERFRLMRWNVVTDIIVVNVNIRRKISDHPVSSSEWREVKASVPSPKSLGFRCVQNGSSARRSEPDWR